MPFSNVPEKKLNISTQSYDDLCRQVITNGAYNVANKLKQIGDDMCYGRMAPFTIVPGIILRETAGGIAAGIYGSRERQNAVGFLASAGLGCAVAGKLGLMPTFATFVAGGAGLSAFAVTALSIVGICAVSALAARMAFNPLRNMAGVLGATLFKGIPRFLKSIPSALANIGTGIARAREAREQKAIAAGADIKLIEGQKNADNALRAIERLPEPSRVALLTDLRRKFPSSFEQAEAIPVALRVTMSKTLKS